MEIAKEIEKVSGIETSLEQNVSEQGPGGQAYELAPTPVAEINAGEPPSQIKQLGKKSASLLLKHPLWAGGFGLTLGLALGLGLGRARRVRRF